jgi:hypothetical protein
MPDDTRTAFPVAHQDILLPDDVIDQILDSLDHQSVDWSETRPIFSLQQTARLMYHAMGFGQGTQGNTSLLPQHTLMCGTISLSISRFHCLGQSLRTASRKFVAKHSLQKMTKRLLVAMFLTGSPCASCKISARTLVTLVSGHRKPRMRKSNIVFSQ